MNGCRLTKMAVEIVSLTHVVTTPDLTYFLTSSPAQLARRKKLRTRFLCFFKITFTRNNFYKYDAILHPLYRARFREKWKAIIERRAAINSRKIGYTIYEQNL